MYVEFMIGGFETRRKEDYEYFITLQLIKITLQKLLSGDTVPTKLVPKIIYAVWK